MWFHDGKWRIGHVSWVDGDPARCCACADAPHGPAFCLKDATFFEHKGKGIDKDHGIPMRDFKAAPGSIAVSASMLEAEVELAPMASASPSAPTMEKKPVMICKKCGLKFAASAKFCGECGLRLESSQEWVMVDKDSVPVATAVSYK